MQTELKIEGMMCDKCVEHVSRALQNVPGVQNVNVNLEARRALVQHEGASPNAMMEAIREEGYDAQLASNSSV